MRLRTAWVAALVVVGLTAVAGCQQAPEHARDAAIARGDAHMASKKYAAATIEYRLALRADPKSGAAYSKMGDAYLAADDLTKAVAAFVRASDLEPDNVALNLRVGNILLVAQRFEDVKTRARSILVRDPNNISALVLLGNALAGLHSLDEAVDVAAKAAALEPGRAGLLGNLGVFEVARGNPQEAERLFLRAANTDPAAVSPLLALANLYQTNGRSKQAETTIRKALSLDPKSVAANSALATLLVQTGRPQQAEPYLRAAADSADSVEASLGLADYLVAIGRLGEGLAMLDKLSETKEGFAASRIRQAIIDHASGRRDEAYATLDELVKRDPRNVPAMALQSRLLLGDNRPDEAEAAVKAAIIVDPRQAQPYVALGRIYSVKGELELARRAFRDALNRESTRLDAQLELVRLHMTRLEFDAAISYADAAARNNPDNLDAALQLVRALAVRPEDLTRAKDQVRALMARYPNSPDVLALGGMVALLDGGRPRALEMFERALRIDPDHVEALGGLATIDADNGRLSNARTRIERRLAASERPDADLLLLAVKIDIAAGDIPRVEDGLKRLVKAAPANLENYKMLGHFYISQRRLPEAKREFEEIAKRNPRLAPVQTMLGLILQAEGDRAGAQRAFQEAIRLDAKSAEASNNLAWMYANDGVRLDEALMLAKAARAQLPRSAMTADTLAFAYYKRGLGSLSLPLLEEALRDEPRNPVFHYHLGLVYAQTGEDAKARKALQAALDLDSRFEGAEDARKAIARLIY